MIEKSKLFKALGLVLILAPTLVTIILGVVFSSMKREYDYYDYELIRAKGVVVKAIVEDIEIRKNIEVKNLNPYVVTYHYLTSSGKNVEDRCEVFESKELRNLSKGSEIKVRYLESQSMLEEFEPSNVSYSFLYIIPAVFIPIGMILLFLSKKRLGT
jgi:hypothetical protein